MRRVAVLFLMLALATTGSSARLVLPFQGHIVNGQDVAPGEYPSQVSLQFLGSHNCGASVLGATLALTAAHCVDGTFPSALSILSGTTDLTSGGTRHQVTRYIIHEDYDPENSWVNDIALLQVDPPFVLSPMVRPIQLPEQDEFTETGVLATVIGWGRTSIGGQPISETLKEVEIEIRDQDLCKQVYNSIGYNVYPSQICADVPEGHMGSCNGDSGGPLMLTQGGVVVGLVSWAQGCAYPGYPTVYTRVAAYRDWIAYHTHL